MDGIHLTVYYRRSPCQHYAPDISKRHIKVVMLFTENQYTMKYLKIVMPLFIGTLIYTLMGLTAGPMGQWRYSRLETEKERLVRNYEKLQHINTNLEACLANLTADPDTIAVYAHELGYIHEGEQLIKLAGFNGGINRNLVPGTALVSVKPDFLPEWICKLIGILFGTIAFFAMNMAYKKR